ADPVKQLVGRVLMACAILAEPVRNAAHQPFVHRQHLQGTLRPAVRSRKRPRPPRLGTQGEVVSCPSTFTSPGLSRTCTTTRRFLARPCAVALLATGCVEP